jgi:hypothetical protein
MRRSTAAIGSAVFFVVAPCVVAGLVPWLISGWGFASADVAARDCPDDSRCLVLLVPAVVVLVRAFARFVIEGGGTPAPVAPTERLVVGGDYRFVRNPMYLAVVTAVLSQAMIFGSLALLGFMPLPSGRSRRRSYVGTRSPGCWSATGMNTSATVRQFGPGFRGCAPGRPMVSPPASRELIIGPDSR